MLKVPLCYVIQSNGPPRLNTNICGVSSPIYPSYVFSPLFEPTTLLCVAVKVFPDNSQYRNVQTAATRALTQIHFERPQTALFIHHHAMNSFIPADMEVKGFSIYSIYRAAAAGPGVFLNWFAKAVV